MPRTPRPRSASTAVAVCAKDCTRLMACCTTGSKVCTPKLARVTPASANVAAMAGLKVRGSISTAISASVAIRNRARKSRIRSSNASGEMMVGVPPPKWTWPTPMAALGRSATTAISRCSAAR